ncbi:MAG TPA: hypothetical protein VMG82_32210 [Candidatus Sulfotelmatobacter sp.]|nr:hypothetical protein [Candidatus Sulfotelmatobacter sp.]
MTYSRCILIAVLILIIGSARSAAQDWKKFVSTDGSFSFQYPADWGDVFEGENGQFELRSPSGAEVIWIGVRPAENGKSPSEYANALMALMHSKNPQLRASMLKADNNQANFEFSYQDFLVPLHRGSAIVFKKRDHVVFLTYDVSASQYSALRTGRLMFLIPLSVTFDDASPDPASSLMRQWSTEISGGISAPGSSGASFGDGYTFYSDGTFRYGLIGGLGGVAVATTETGTFAVEGNVLTLHATAVRSQSSGSSHITVEPENETRKYRWYLEDEKTLVLIDPETKARDKFHAVIK